MFKLWVFCIDIDYFVRMLVEPLRDDVECCLLTLSMLKQNPLLSFVKSNCHPEV